MTEEDANKHVEENKGLLFNKFKYKYLHSDYSEEVYLVTQLFVAKLNKHKPWESFVALEPMSETKKTLTKTLTEFLNDFTQLQQPTC